MRDPRYRAINIGYISLLYDLEHLKLFSEYGEVSLHEINHLPEMAFDHYNIVKSAYQYMRDKVAHFSLI
jgi:8-oxo-dGTP diphosphatase